MHRPGAIAGSPQPTYAIYYPPTPPGAYPMSYPTPGPSYGTPQQGVPAVRPRPQVMTTPFSPAFVNGGQGQGQMQGQVQGQGQQGMSMIGSPSPNKASFPHPFILPQQPQQQLQQLQQQSQQQYGNGQSYPNNGTMNTAASYPQQAQQQLQAQQLQQAQQQQAQQQFFQQQLMQQHHHQQQQMQGMSDNNNNNNGTNTGGGNDGPLPENMMQLLARSNPPSPSRDLSPGVRIMTSPGMGGENIQ